MGTNKKLDVDYINQLRQIHQSLGINKDYLNSNYLYLFEQAQESDLVLCGKDCFQRDYFLIDKAYDAFSQMVKIALESNIIIEVVSAFRTIHYQANLIEKKLQLGQIIDEVIAVNAPPGFSEHHTGRALDITTPEEKGVLTEKFENTKAFHWLTNYGEHFGFKLSYPRGNKHGYIYEPWHWCYNE